MLERMQDAPEHALALKASGTVMARDIEAAVNAAVGESTVGTGLVVVVDPDFDGYFTELARGLTTVSLAHKNVVRIAVVTQADQIEEAKISGFSVSAVPIRLYADTDRKAAYDWADATRRGE